MSKHKLPQWVRNVKASNGNIREKEQFARIFGSFLWYGQNLSMEAFHVYTHLRMFLWKDNPGPVFPSIDTLETVTKLSRAILLDAIEELEKFGWLKITRGLKTITVRGKEIETENNLYEFKLPMESIPGTDQLRRRFSPVNKAERQIFKRAQSKKRRGNKEIDVESFVSRMKDQIEIPDDGCNYKLTNPTPVPAYTEDEEYADYGDSDYTDDEEYVDYGDSEEIPF